jgi:hypothetical protein
MASTDVRLTQGAVLELVQEVEGVGHKIFMQNYFTSSKLFSDVHHRKINAFSTVHHNRKDVSPNKKFMILLICMFLLQKVTSRKVGKL